MINSLYPHIDKTYISVRNETVGSLQGWIGVTFDDDKRIKKVSFTHSYIVPKEDAILEFQEFAELINSKYNLGWNTNEDHVFTYESEKDDVIFYLDEEFDRVLGVSESKRRSLERELNRVIKKKYENGIYKWELEEIEELKKEYQLQITDFKVSYMFSLL